MWQEVDELEKKALGKQIIQKVNTILQKAIEEEETNQVFRALAIRSKHIDAIEEESTYKIIQSFEQQIATSKSPFRELLHSATAELYDQYLQQNRWKLNQRIPVENIPLDDFRTWSSQDLEARIKLLYLKSVRNENVSLNLPLTDLDYILKSNQGIEESPQAYAYRPTQYNLLVDRALLYFKRNELNSLHQFYYEKNTRKFFLPIDQICSTNSITDSTHVGLCNLLYRKTICSHRSRGETAAEVDYNLQRLSYHRRKFKSHVADSMYINALNKYKEAIPNEFKVEVDLALAEVYLELGRSYNFNDNKDAHRWYLNKSLKVCTKHLNNSIYSENFKQIVQSILEPRVHLIAEAVYSTQESILFYTQYKNTKELFFRLIKVPHRIPGMNEQNIDDRYQALIHLNPLKEWTETLPEENDHQFHATELFIPKQGAGNYTLIVSSDSSFKLADHRIAFVNFQVSQLSYLSKSLQKEVIIQLFDRESGQLLKNTQLHEYHKMRLPNGINSWVKKDIRSSNDSGKVHLKLKESGSIRFYLTQGKDTLSVPSIFYLNPHRQKQHENIRSLIFSDRNFYRPGQTVFFKGIVSKSSKKEKAIIPNRIVTVGLYGPKGELIKNAEFKTNEFGSYHGAFDLPDKGLNGSYRITDNYSSINIQVEEYKRPTFRIVFDSTLESFQINDSVRVSGRLETFSGMPLNDCRLKYTVRYSPVHYPYNNFLRNYIPPKNTAIIESGSLKSDADGKFVFSFMAKEEINNQFPWKNFVRYTVSIEASRLNGETQKTSKDIHLGRHSVYLSTNLNQHAPISSLKELVITSRNIEGKKIPAKVSLELYSLVIPEKPIKNKPWQKPDRQVIPNNVYEREFPYYSQEDGHQELEDYAISNFIASSLVESNKPFDLFRFPREGAYLLKLSTKDENGSIVELEQRFVLFNPTSKKIHLPTFYWGKLLKDTLNVGEDAEIVLSSSLKNLTLHGEVMQNNTVVDQFSVNIENEQKKLSLPLPKNIDGRASILLYGVYANRTIEHKYQLYVANHREKIQLKIERFRSEHRPGDQVKWTIKLNKANPEFIPYELIASMYDKSLDQLLPFKWSMPGIEFMQYNTTWQHGHNFKSTIPSWYGGKATQKFDSYVKKYPMLNWFDFRLNAFPEHYRPIQFVMNDLNSRSEGAKAYTNEMLTRSLESPQKELSYRSNFNETAFFYPSLKANKKGEVSMEFQLPESIGKWKLQMLAHTKDMSHVHLIKELISKKPLSVHLNEARFLRQGDTVMLNAVITNTTEKKISLSANIQFFDAHTEKAIDMLFSESSTQSISVEPEQNKKIGWKIVVPDYLDHLLYRLSVEDSYYKDGVEGVIPILSNKSTVIESLPFHLNPGQHRKFSFSPYVEHTSNTTIKNKSYTFEYTANPIWNVVNALPYLMDPIHESSKQLFNQYFSNKLSSILVKQHPEIERIYSLLQNTNATILNPTLFGKENVKNIRIEETPWLSNALSEEERLSRIQRLFNPNRVAYSEKEALEKLSNAQLPNGAWPWFKGMRANRHITQYILGGLGRLLQLNVLNEDDPILQKAIGYIDQQAHEEFLNLKKRGDTSEYRMNSSAVNYLYCRSFFGKTPIKHPISFEFYLNKAREQWKDFELRDKALFGISIKKLYNDEKTAQEILNSIIDNALVEENMGMYWKANRRFQRGYSSIEIQAYLIEFFEELKAADEYINGLKKWLLKNKQTHVWENSSSTASACYVLLNTAEILSTGINSEISIGGKTQEDLMINSKGLGYVKKQWDATEMDPSLGEIEIHNSGETDSWGALYWQYEQKNDSIKEGGSNALAVKKELFKVDIKDKKEILIPLDKSELRLGDRIRILLQINNAIDLQFVHLKDERAASFEPTTPISSYQWSEGIGYYMNTKDASTHYFIDNLPKGKHLLSYDAWLTQEGVFSTGKADVQSQYSPEFNAHSANSRFKVVAP